MLFTHPLQKAHIMLRTRFIDTN